MNSDQNNHIDKIRKKNDGDNQLLVKYIHERNYVMHECDEP